MALLSAQAATYTVDRAKIAGGGGAGAGGPFTLNGIAGQADAHGARASGGFAVAGGLWARPRLAVGNRLPVAGDDLVVRLHNALQVKVSFATLLGNDVDPDGDPLSLLAVSDALPAGAAVVIDGPWVIYTVPAVDAGTGSFRYTLSDGLSGRTANGVVAVSVALPPDAGAPKAVAVISSDHSFSVSFQGAPGYRYRVQFSTSLSAPYVWQDFQPAAVYTAQDNGTGGAFRHTDDDPPEPVRFYRAVPEP